MSNPLVERITDNNTIQLVEGGLRALWHVGKLEQQEGSLGATIKEIVRQRSLAFASDWTFADLIEWSAARYRFKPFLEYGDQVYSFNDMNRRANRIAHSLLAQGIKEQRGVAIMMSNHPRFLDTFFAIQKAAAYAVPVNTALIGEGLGYIISHSEVSAIVCDHDAALKLDAIRPHLEGVKHIWVNLDEAPADFVLPAGMENYNALEHVTVMEGDNPGIRPAGDSPSLLLYTSGTTGLPKAVVSPYDKQRVKQLGMLANLINRKSDKLYSCLPLFHANALMLSVMQCLWVGIPLHLSKRFSASRFWSELAHCGATQFNTVGSMIPVLLKTPPSPYDRQHKVRRVISAACPKDAWLPFEQRFGVKLWEAYGAVDGAGVAIINTGTAPVGSIGKPARSMQWKLVKEDGDTAVPGEPGELCIHVGSRSESRVLYWKNDKASNEKVQDGWLHTGDLMQADKRGFLYFVGRNSDSMRVRGENVSAFEVEKVVDAYPDILESAAYAVPSDLGEDDIMLSVVLVEGATLEAGALLQYLRANLPKFAVPAWLAIREELPKTGTHRVIKKELKEAGVTTDAIRLNDDLLK